MPKLQMAKGYTGKDRKLKNTGRVFLNLPKESTEYMGWKAGDNCIIYECNKDENTLTLKKI